jgi:hypothetical protein
VIHELFIPFGVRNGWDFLGGCFANQASMAPPFLQPSDCGLMRMVLGFTSTTWKS